MKRAPNPALPPSVDEAPEFPRGHVDTPPSDESYKAHPWEQPHRGNPTGTPAAIRPKGSTMVRGHRQATGGDYQAWIPNP